MTTSSNQSSAGTTPSAAHRRDSRFLVVLTIVLAVAIAVTWTLVARRQLDASNVADGQAQIDRARNVLGLVRTTSQTSLRTLSRVLVEDPRLKATLTTEGIDEATIADILEDLNKVRGSGFLLILSAQGRVRAQAGAPELRGVDLSTSSVVRKLREGKEPAVGAWMIGKELHDLAASPMRFDNELIGFLVVGQEIDQALVTSLTESTGVTFGIAIGDSLLVGTTDAALRSVIEQLARGADDPVAHVFEHGGVSYIVAVTELEQTAQARSRLLLARPLAPTSATYGKVRGLLFAPPILILVVGVLIAWLATRRRSGGS